MRKMMTMRSAFRSSKVFKRAGETAIVGAVSLLLAHLAAPTGAYAELPATPRTLITPITGFSNYNQAAAPKGDGGFIVAYIRSNSSGLGTVRVRQFNSIGTQTSPEAAIDASIGFHGDIEIYPINGSWFAVFWNRNGDIVGGYFNSATNRMGIIRTFGRNLDFGNPVTRMSNGNFVITHMLDVGTGANQREVPAVTVLNSSLVRISGPTAVFSGKRDQGSDNFHDYTVARLASGAISIFFDRVSKRILGRVITPTGQLTSTIRQINTTALRGATFVDTYYNEVKSAVLTNGNVLVVWSLPTDSTLSSWNIRYRLLSPTGAPISAEIVANTIRTNRQYYPEIVPLPQGRFSIVWLSEETAAATRWYARTFNSNGSPAALPRIIEQGPYTVMGTSSAIGLRDGSIANIFGGGYNGNGGGLIKGDGFRP